MTQFARDLLAHPVVAARLVRENQSWTAATQENTGLAYQAYLAKYSNGYHAPEATARMGPLLAAEDAAFASARAANTSQAYLGYLGQYPGPRHRSEALGALAIAVSREPDRFERYDALILQYPEFIAVVPDEDRVQLVGPRALKIHEILSQLKEGVGQETLRAKILATGGPYKVFTREESLLLVRAGVPDALTGAMIQVTPEYRRAQQQRQERAESQGEMARLQERIRTLEQQPRERPTAMAQGNSGPSGSDVALECVKQAAASQACNRLPGIMGSICQATAESGFTCPVSMRR